MKPLVLIDVFNVELKVSASTKVWSHDGDFAIESRSLYSEISLFGTILMRHSTGWLFIWLELFALKEVIHLAFGFKEYDDRPFLPVYLRDI